MDLRIARGGATLLFFFFVVFSAVADEFDWKRVVAAVLFGAMAAFMWAADLQAQADLRADRQREEQKARLERLRGPQGQGNSATSVLPPGPNTGSWS